MKHLCLLLITTLLLTQTALAGELPDIFDIRDIDGHSYIGAVRNQGQCGSCYAFGTLAAAESTYNRANNLYNENAIDLSESFIVWSLGSRYDGILGCNGANQRTPLNGVLKYGVPLESDFPYIYPDPGEENYHWDAPRINFAEWYRIPPNDIETMKRVIHQFGALEAAVWVKNDFYVYQDGILKNSDTTIDSIVPYGSSANHLISLVGWNDNPEGEMGYWMLRNSWSDRWGEDGYMNIEYTSANVGLLPAYFLTGKWPGTDINYINSQSIRATPWEAGGILNAHAVDIWSGNSSSVVNSGTLEAMALGEGELTSARGIYLWGGPSGYVDNSGTIVAQARSETNHAIAYGISMQGGGGENNGMIQVEANSVSGQALAYGVQVFNGGSPVEFSNSGTITSSARGDDGWAYGVWTDSRSQTHILNQGAIHAQSNSTSAVAVLLSGRGTNELVNSGRIEATADSGEAYGVYSVGETIIFNSGEIIAVGAATHSIKSDSHFNTRLVLAAGSDLSGRVLLDGADDLLELYGSGSEDEVFLGVETLLMSGTAWSLSGDSAFEHMDIDKGVFSANGRLTVSDRITIGSSGTLGGSGWLIGNVLNQGRIAPGNSIGTLTIDGDYTHEADAVFEVEMGDGLSDLLIVTGTADIQGGSISLLPTGYLTAGSYSFLEAGDLQGAFALVETPAVFNTALDTSAANALALDLTRNSYTSLAGDSSQASLSTALDGMRPASTGDMADILNRMDTMDLSTIHSAMDDLMPKFYNSITAATLDDIHERNAFLRNRISDGTEEGRSARLWFSALGSNAEYDAVRESSAFRSKLKGIMLGGDRRLYPGLRLGWAGAYSQSDIHELNSGGSNTTDSYTGYLYGVWNQPERTGGYYARTVLGLGQNYHDSNRFIPFLNRSATGKYDSWQHSILMDGGYNFTTDAWSFGPRIAAEYSRLKEDGFHENQADSASLTVSSKDSESFLGIVGVKASRTFIFDKMMLVPDIRADWIYAFKNGGGNYTATFSETGHRFNVDGRESASDSWELNLGLKAIFANGITAHINYLRTLQSHGGYSSHQAGIGLDFRF